MATAKRGKPPSVPGKETKEAKRHLPPSKKTLAEEARAKKPAPTAPAK
jgi:hypothetical protein